VKEWASHLPRFLQLLSEPWVTPIVIIVGIGLIFGALLERDSSATFNIRWLPTKYQEARIPHVYFVGIAVIVAVLLVGFRAHGRREIIIPLPSEQHTTVDQVRAEKSQPPPSLVFGFFTLDTSVFPLVRQSIPVVNDIVSVDFFARNMSEGISATFGEIWVRIPDDGGRYAEEPEGFHRVSGAFERERSTNFDILYAHSFLRKMTVKFFVPRNWQFLTLGLKYACQNCGAVDNWQTLTVDLVRASGKDNVAIRKGLGELIARAVPIRDKAPVYVGAPPEDIEMEWEAWAKRVEQFLAKNYDSAEVEKFRSLNDPNTSLNSKLHYEIGDLEALLDKAKP
jgi:hypothetical protein